MSKREAGEIRMEKTKKGLMTVLRLNAKYHGESTGRLFKLMSDVVRFEFQNDNSSLQY